MSKESNLQVGNHRVCHENEGVEPVQPVQMNIYQGILKTYTGLLKLMSQVFIRGRK